MKTKLIKKKPKFFSKETPARRGRPPLKNPEKQVQRIKAPKDFVKPEKRFALNDFVMTPFDGCHSKPTSAVDTTAWVNRANI